MTDSDILSLSSGDFSAALSPCAGGSVLYWRRRDDDLLRPALNGAVDRRAADETAMFPLVPYSNRIRGGYFIYWGIRRTVPKNHPFVPDPLHGEGWQKEWAVVRSSADSAVLAFEHGGTSGFPFAYEG